MFSSFRRCSSSSSSAARTALSSSYAYYASSPPQLFCLAHTAPLFTIVRCTPARSFATTSPAQQQQRRQPRQQPLHVASQRARNNNNNAASREELWKHFTAAARQLNRAVRSSSTSPSPSSDSQFSSSVVRGQGPALFSPRLADAPATRSEFPTTPNGNFLEGEEDGDAALFAFAPAIVRHTSTAAANAALMQQLGVVDRAEHRPAAAATPAVVSQTAVSSRVSPPLMLDTAAWTPHVLRVCQTGIQAQVPSSVILRHLFEPFRPSSALRAEEKEKAGENKKAEAVSAASEQAPSMEWCAGLPVVVRHQLLSHELARVARRTRFVTSTLQDHHFFSLPSSTTQTTATTSSTSSPSSVASALPWQSQEPPLYTRVSLSEMWTSCTSESRRVLRCCAAPWLMGGAKSDVRRALLSAAERQVLLLSVQLAGRCQAEDVALQLMDAFVAGVDAQVKELAAGAQRNRSDVEQRNLDTFATWYESEGVQVYEAAMFAAAQQQRHVRLASHNAAGAADFTDRNGKPRIPVPRDGFTTAYGYLVHRGSTLARLEELLDQNNNGEEDAHDHQQTNTGDRNDAESRETKNDQLDDAAAARWTKTPLRSSAGTAPSSTAALLQHPAETMTMLRHLADAVATNADHFHLVRQLYHRLLEDTDVGYTANNSNSSSSSSSSSGSAKENAGENDGAAVVRQALCALLRALSRLPLTPQTTASLLDDVHRRTQLNSAAETLPHASVLAASLEVCTAASLPSRAVSLFNQLAEPRTRVVALQENNLAALGLAQADASQVLQRWLSFTQTKLPVTADMVHAGVARALLSASSPSSSSAAATPGESSSSVSPSSSTSLASTSLNTTAVFAALDLLHSRDVQNRTTRSSALFAADRTFYLRVLTLLARVAETDESAPSLAPLHTAAAGAIFEQWVEEFKEAARRTHKTGTMTMSDVKNAAAWKKPLKNQSADEELVRLLSPVTVGVLQDLLLRLLRSRPCGAAASPNDAENDEQTERRIKDASTTETFSKPEMSPLMLAVAQLLGCVSPLFSPAVDSWCEVEHFLFSPSQHNLPPSQSSGSNSVTIDVTVPAALKWRQLLDEWSVRDQERFLTAFTQLFTNASSSSSFSAADATSTAVLRMGYEDFTLLTDLYRNWQRAVVASESAHAWSSRVEASSQPPPSLEAFVARRLRNGVTPACLLRVRDPLAEVQSCLCSSKEHSSQKVVLLSEVVKVAVPPVMGCPTYDWKAPRNAMDAAAVGGSHAPHRVSVTTYWLKRWVDAVEDSVVLPQHSLFRDAVSRALDQAAFAPTADAEGGDAMEEGETADQYHHDGEVGSVNVGETSSEMEDAAETSAKKAWREGVEELWVRGPA